MGSINHNFMKKMQHFFKFRGIFAYPIFEIKCPIALRVTTMLKPHALSSVRFTVEFHGQTLPSLYRKEKVKLPGQTNGNVLMGKNRGIVPSTQE